MIGALSVAGATLALSQMTALWQYYLLYFVFGALGHAALVSPLWANIGQWFTENKGIAFGVALAGGAFGQAVVPFSARLIISTYDWQTAYLVLGSVYLALGLAIASLTRDPPAKQAYLQELSRSQVKRMSWALGEARYDVTWISFAVIFCCFCMSLTIVHIVPLVSDKGFSPEISASVLTVMMVFGVLGRIGAGKICDLIKPLPTYMLMSFGQSVLVVWFPQIDSLIGIYALAALFGFAYSGVMSCMVVTVNTFVPGDVSARSWSIVAFFAWIGMGLGPYMGGMLFDLTGSYTFPFAFAGLIGAVNLIVLILFHFARTKRKLACTLE